MSKTKFNIFEFKRGKEKRSLKEWIQVGAILHGSLDLISLIPGVEKKKVFNLVDIDRVVTKAISEYEKDNV